MTFQHADTFLHGMKRLHLHCMKLNEYNMLFLCTIHNILHLIYCIQYTNIFNIHILHLHHIQYMPFVDEMVV